MNQFNLVKQLSINALFWVGVVAIALSLLAGSLYFLIFFIGLILFNLVIVNLIAKAEPNALNEIPSIASAVNSQAPVKSTPAGVSAPGVLGFKFTPVSYPKVMDSEIKDFAPEFINVVIEQNGSAVFSGSFERDALKKFRDGLSQVLSKNAQEQKNEKPQEPVQIAPTVITATQNAITSEVTPAQNTTAKKTKKSKKS